MHTVTVFYVVLIINQVRVFLISLINKKFIWKIICGEVMSDNNTVKNKNK